MVKELEKYSREKEKEHTPPVPTETEAEWVVTYARQCQQDALEEEGNLRQEQDRPIITMLDSVDHGEQAEGAEDNETEEGQAEAPGMSQVEEQCTEAFEIADQTKEFGTENSPSPSTSPEKIKEEQHRDPSLRKLRDKA